jgi:hypothetical protein
MSASPRAAGALLEMNSQADIRAALPSISAPTLLLYLRDDLDVNIAEGCYIAAAIDGSRFVELVGGDHIFFASDPEPILQEIEEFMTGSRGFADPDRRLATVLFTDVVASTQRAAELGDRRWREVLELHNRAIRDELGRFRGEDINTTGEES